MNLIESLENKSTFGAIEKEARQKNKSIILLKCPEDLPANQFYGSIGYTKMLVETGKIRRLNVWQKILIEDSASR